MHQIRAAANVTDDVPQTYETLFLRNASQNLTLLNT